MTALEQCFAGQYDQVAVGSMPVDCLPGALHHFPDAGEHVWRAGAAGAEIAATAAWASAHGARAAFLSKQALHRSSSEASSTQQAAPFLPAQLIVAFESTDAAGRVALGYKLVALLEGAADPALALRLQPLMQQVVELLECGHLLEFVAIAVTTAALNSTFLVGDVAVSLLRSRNCVRVLRMLGSSGRGVAAEIVNAVTSVPSKHTIHAATARRVLRMLSSLSQGTALLVRQSLLDHQKHATLVLDITQHALGDGASLLSGIADAADPRAAALWDFVVSAITRPPDPPAAAVAASFRAHLLLRARSALASEGVVPATLCHVRAYALLLCGDLVPTAQESRAWLECMGGTRDRACSEAVPLQATLLTLLLSHSVLIQRDLISTLKAICLSARSAPPRAAKATNAGVVGPAPEPSSEPQDPRTRPAKRHKPQPGQPATLSPSASIQGADDATQQPLPTVRGSELHYASPGATALALKCHCEATAAAVQPLKAWLHAVLAHCKPVNLSDNAVVGLAAAARQAGLTRPAVLSASLRTLPPASALTAHTPASAAPGITVVGMLLDRKIDATQLEPFVSQWLCEQLLLSAEPVNQELVSAVQAGARAAAGRTGGVKIPPLDLDRLVHVVHAEAHLVGAGSSAAPLAALYMLVYVNGCHAAGVDVWRWVDALHELPVTQLWERMEAASKQTPRPPRKGAHQQPALANTSSAAGQATARTGSGGDGADRSEGPARGQVPDDAGVAGGSASGAERPGGAGAGRDDSGYKQIMRVWRNNAPYLLVPPARHWHGRYTASQLAPPVPATTPQPPASVPHPGAANAPGTNATAPPAHADPQQRNLLQDAALRCDDAASFAQLLSRYWHVPALMTRLVRAHSGALQQASESGHLCTREQVGACVRCAGVLLVTALSHPHARVLAEVAAWWVRLPQPMHVRLWPLVLWRLSLPVAAAHTPPQNAATTVPKNADTLGADAWVTGDGVAALLQELPPYCELVCTPHAVLACHASVWRHPALAACVLDLLDESLRSLRIAAQRLLVPPPGGSHTAKKAESKARPAEEAEACATVDALCHLQHSAVSHLLVATFRDLTACQFQHEGTSTSADSSSEGAGQADAAFAGASQCRASADLVLQYLLRLFADDACLLPAHLLQDTLPDVITRAVLHVLPEAHTAVPLVLELLATSGGSAQRAGFRAAGHLISTGAAPPSSPLAPAVIATATALMLSTCSAGLRAAVAPLQACALARPDLAPQAAAVLRHCAEHRGHAGQVDTLQAPHRALATAAFGDCSRHAQRDGGAASASLPHAAACCVDELLDRLLQPLHAGEALVSL